MSATAAGSADSRIARLARWAMARRLRIAAAWTALLVITMLASNAAGTHFKNDLELAGTDSQRASTLLRESFPAKAGDVDEVVLHTSGGSVDSPSVRARVAPMLQALSALPHVTGVASPFLPGRSAQIAGDGRTAFAVVSFDGQATELPVGDVERVIATAQRARTPSLAVELGGQGIEQAQRPSLGAATAIGLLAAIVILLITFGSALAMSLPIVTALLGLGTALAAAGLASHVVETPDFATQLAALIGLGVGIDYALFVVTRFRTAYREHEELEAAVASAMDTAGRAVLFAGATVIIALLGLFSLGVSLLYGVAVAASLSVLLTMLAALTALPALLSRFGERIGAAGSRGDAAGSRGSSGRGRAPLWPRWTAAVQRRPRLALGAGLAVMLVLAAPATALRLGFSDAGNDPAGKTTRRAYDLLAAGFGSGFNAPLKVVVAGAGASRPQTASRVSATLRETPDVAGISQPERSADGRTLVLTAYPASAPQALATTRLVDRLRAERLPPLARQEGVRILVGGQQATSVDFTNVLSGKLALFIGVVVGLSALLLLAMFRSVAIPIQAAAMNLLSVAASLGVVVAVFQWGWLGSLLGVRSAPIEPFIPVVMFAIVFGLSMDYEVFLVSRIHEAWSRSRDATGAIHEGFGSTGRVITAAATIMLVVFLSFVTGEQRVVKVFGLSLASAVFLDAFVVRSLLLPAVLELLGERAWALPRALERLLPRLAIAASAARPDGPLPRPEPAPDAA